MAKGGVTTKFIPPPMGLDLTQMLVTGLPERAIQLDNLIAGRNGPYLPWQRLLSTSANQSNGAYIFNQGTSRYQIDGSNPPKIYSWGSGVALFTMTGGSATDAWNWATQEITTPAGAYVVVFGNALGQNIQPAVGKSGVFSNFTPVGPSNLTKIYAGATFRKRFYFLDSTQPNGFWYLPIDAISGTASFYSTGSIFPRSSKVVAMNSLSIDGGIGSDDLLVAWTAEGEAAVFSGADPSAPDWQIIGVFNVGTPPTGSIYNPQLMVKLGGDLLVMTTKGIVSMTELMRGKDPATVKTISWRIDPALTFRARLATFQRWKLYLLKSQSLLLAVTEIDTLVCTYVLNLTTGEWSRFKGTGSTLGFSVAWMETPNGGDTLINSIQSGFGIADNFVVSVSTGVNGLTDETCTIVTPFSRFGQVEPFDIKTVRPFMYFSGATLSGTSNMTYTLGHASDFIMPHSTAETIGGNATNFASAWNVGTPGYFWGAWNESLGTGQSRFSRPSYAIRHRPGFCSSFKLQFSPVTANAPDYIQFLGMDVSYETLGQINP